MLFYREFFPYGNYLMNADYLKLMSLLIKSKLPKKIQFIGELEAVIDNICFDKLYNFFLITCYKVNSMIPCRLFTLMNMNDENSYTVLKYYLKTLDRENIRIYLNELNTMYDDKYDSGSFKERFDYCLNYDHSISADIFVMIVMLNDSYLCCQK